MIVSSLELDLQDFPNPHNPIIQANGVPYHTTRGERAAGLRVTVGTIPYHPGGPPAAGLQSYMGVGWRPPSPPMVMGRPQTPPQ